MASINQLPDEILLMIFSYLSIDDLSFSIRDVCPRWREVSEDDKIWFNLRYCPSAQAGVGEINSMLENMPALRQFHFYGTFNFIQKLCECCKRIRVLHIPYTTLSENSLTSAMRCLTELSELGISISPLEEGILYTRVIGQCVTLVSLTLYSSLGQIAERRLLRPIADGCPNLTVLKCRLRNSPTDEICYFLHRKKRQLVTYEHHGPLTARIFKALNKCTDLKSLSFFGDGSNGLFRGSCPITKLQNLKSLEISYYELPTVRIITLTLFVSTLSHLSYIGLCCIGGYIDDLTNSIIQKCPLLTHLNLEENRLHYTGLRNIHSCTMLKYLDVSACGRLERRAMAYIAEGCPQLQHLDVSRNPVSREMFREILRCRNLKTLLMKNCHLTDINLCLISTHINGLLYLLVGPEFELPDEVRNQLKQEMPQLLIKEFSVSSDESEYLRMKTDPLPKYFC
jgi:Leucine-rich repeat (LRR) protein